MSNTPAYASTPNTIPLCQISVANTARDGTGTLGTVLTAGASGSRIDALTIQATGTTTAGQVRLFLSDGVNTRLIREIAVSAITPSSTVQAFNSTLSYLSVPDFMPLVIPAGFTLKASTHNAETFNIIPTMAGNI